MGAQTGTEPAVGMKLKKAEWMATPSLWTCWCGVKAGQQAQHPLSTSLKCLVHETLPLFFVQ